MVSYGDSALLLSILEIIFLVYCRRWTWKWHVLHGHSSLWIYKENSRLGFQEHADKLSFRRLQQRMLAVIPQMKYDLNYLQNYFSLQILKALMNTVAMRKYQPKISKAFWKLFFYTWIVLNVHMQYHVHIVTFLHVCDQNLLIHVHVRVYIALCFVIKVLIFNILLNVLSWTYVWKTSRPRFIP